MDLANLKPVEESQKLYLQHPTDGGDLDDGKGKKFYIAVVGADSNKYQNLLKRQIEKSAGKKNRKLDLDESTRRACEMLAKCTTDCYLLMDGKKVECDFEAMFTIYKDYSWIKEQVEEFINDRANFIKS